MPATKSLIGLLLSNGLDEKFGIPQKMKAARIINGIPDNVNKNLRNQTKRFVWANAKHTEDNPITIAIANEIKS